MCKILLWNDYCWSPAPAARDSTWRDGQCQRWGSLSIFFWTDCLFQVEDSLLYFYKNIRPEVWHFQFPLSQIYYLHKSLLLFKQSSCFSDSLGISLIIYNLSPLMCPIVNLWLHCNSCYIPHFTTYLPKSYLPLTSWAHCLLKRLLAIVSLKIPNFYQFSSVQLFSRVRLFATPWTAARQASLSITNFYKL